MEKVNYTPLNNIVLIKQDEKVIKEEVTAAGIYVKSEQQVAKETKEVLRGTVVAVAASVENLLPVGSKVDWQPFRNYPVEIDGVTYQKVPFDEIHGIIGQ